MYNRLANVDDGTSVTLFATSISCAKIPANFEFFAVVSASDVARPMETNSSVRCCITGSAILRLYVNVQARVCPQICTEIRFIGKLHSIEGTGEAVYRLSPSQRKAAVTAFWKWVTAESRLMKATVSTPSLLMNPSHAAGYKA
jgi:hypothetical protein